MKYSLRSLMIVVTLSCVVGGGRIEYLRRWAVFHEREAAKLRCFESKSASETFDHLISLIEHESLAVAYRRGVYRPWTMVDEDQAKVSEVSSAEMGMTIDP